MSAGEPHALDLEQLMRMLASVEARSASFVEEKRVGLLTEPLVYRGTLAYEAPDYLAKRFESADVESYEVRADRLRIDSPDGTYRTLALDAQPLVRAFIDAFRATLAGDLARLTASYHATVEGTAGSWRLRLVPKRGDLAEYVAAVIIDGAQARVHSVETREPNGDSSLMTLESPGG